MREVPRKSSRKFQGISQRRRDDNKNKICGFEGGGERKSAQNAFFFRGKCHDNIILKVQILLLRNFVVIAQAPNFGEIGSSWEVQKLSRSSGEPDSLPPATRQNCFQNAEVSMAGCDLKSRFTISNRIVTVHKVFRDSLGWHVRRMKLARNRFFESRISY